MTTVQYKDFPAVLRLMERGMKAQREEEQEWMDALGYVPKEIAAQIKADDLLLKGWTIAEEIANAEAIEKTKRAIDNLAYYAT
tara:strand:+ start:434 stop:682 length:249 start_codon:yes stop_codon:yes gene_type:complete